MMKLLASCEAGICAKLIDTNAGEMAEWLKAAVC